MSSLERFPEIHVCCSKHGMVWHKMDNSRQGVQQLLMGFWTLGKLCGCEYQVAVFPFLARQQAMPITVQKLLCRREISLRRVAMHLFISANAP